MKIEMKMPSPGESITEVEIARWLVSDGDYVERDQLICEIDSDKATLELNAAESGAIKIVAGEGTTIAVGDLVCTIDTAVTSGKSPASAEATAGRQVPSPKSPASADLSTEDLSQVEATAGRQAPSGKESRDETVSRLSSYATGHPSPVAKKMMDEHGITAESIAAGGKGGRITKADVLMAMTVQGKRAVERKKMSSLRKKLSQRLVAVKNQTAMLTTFNEVDMSAIMAIRKKYKEEFEKKHGVKLGFMSFFTKAVTEALGHFPAVNAMIDGDEIIYHKFVDIGIAVSSPRGLVVPVLKNAESMTFAQIESAIMELAVKAREGKITIEEMTGGTFTITNGGIFGSMLSTPILNPPQSAILGMHNIAERPVAINGKVEIRPVMYIALSYDHRVIDGKESVGFLVEVKAMLEAPDKINPVQILLEL